MKLITGIKARKDLWAWKVVQEEMCTMYWIKYYMNLKLLYNPCDEKSYQWIQCEKKRWVSPLLMMVIKVLKDKTGDFLYF